MTDYHKSFVEELDDGDMSGTTAPEVSAGVAAEPSTIFRGHWDEPLFNNVEFLELGSSGGTRGRNTSNRQSNPTSLTELPSPFMEQKPLLETSRSVVAWQGLKPEIEENGGPSSAPGTGDSNRSVASEGGWRRRSWASLLGLAKFAARTSAGAAQPGAGNSARRGSMIKSQRISWLNGINLSSSFKLQRQGILKATSSVAEDGTIVRHTGNGRAKGVTLHTPDVDEEELKKNLPSRMAMTVHRPTQRHWEEIMFVIYLYEAVAIPIRMILRYSDAWADKMCWLCEARNSAMPSLDILVDIIFLCNIWTSIRQKRYETQLWRRTCRAGPRVHLDSERFYNNPMIKYLVSAEFFVHRILGVVLFWMLQCFYAPSIVFWASQLLRLPRVQLIFSYLRDREVDPNVNINLVATVKFIIMIFLAMHWIGCGFWFLAITAHFQTDEVWMSWVPMFQKNMELLSPDWTLSANMGDELNGAAYLMIVYKGMNMLTNIGYENVVPRRYEDLVMSVVVIFIQMVIEAYILGTLFHYLVKSDPLEEAFSNFMHKVDKYCKARRLPMKLHQQLRNYFEFQHRQSRQDDSVVADFLPHSTRTSLAQHLYGSVLKRNQFLFHSCHPHFKSALLVELREVFLMPGGVMFHERDMARELCFVTQGIMEKVSNGKVINVMYAETDSPNILGEVAFLMRVPHPYMAQARTTNSATLLTINHDVFEHLIAPYPDSFEQLMTNLLLEYDLDSKGQPTVASNPALDEDLAQEKAKIVAIIKEALSKRSADSMGAVKFAIVAGKSEDVKNILLDGFDITSADYDGRQVLHFAAIAGDAKLLHMLVDNFGASPTVTDRWGLTPLDYALSKDHTSCVTLLQQHVPSGLNGPRYIRELCYAAASGAVDIVARNVANGVDPDLSPYDCRTALHIAAACNSLKVMEYLLGRGANLNQEDRWGVTPLDEAVLNGHDLMAHILRSNGAKLGKNLRTNPRHIAMHLMTAASSGDLSKVKIMVESGIDPNVQDYDRRTSLHVVASDGMLLSTAFLLEKCNANVNPVDRWQKTPMQDALAAGHMTVALLLKAHGGSLGPGADQSLLELLDAEDLLSLQDIKSLINKQMRQQTRRGGRLQDTSANTDGQKRMWNMVLVLVPEIPRVVSSVAVLCEKLMDIREAIAPTLEMLSAVLGEPEPSANKLQAGATPSGNSFRMKHQETLRKMQSFNRVPNVARLAAALEDTGKGSSDPAKLSFSKPGGRRRPAGVRKPQDHGLFTRCLMNARHSASILRDLQKRCSTGEAEVEAMTDEVLHFLSLPVTQIATTSIQDDVNVHLTQRQNSGPDESFAAILCSGPVHDLVAATGAVRGGTPRDIQVRRQAVASILDLLKQLWILISPDGDLQVPLQALESQRISQFLTTGGRMIKEAMRELGYAESFLTEPTLLQVVLFLSGSLLLEFDSSDDDESGGSDTSSAALVNEFEIGETSDGHGEVGLAGASSRSVAGNPQQAQMQDKVNAILAEAVEQIAQFERWRQSHGLKAELWMYFSTYVLRQPSLEHQYLEQMFRLVDEDCTGWIDDAEFSNFITILTSLVERMEQVDPSAIKITERVVERKKVIESINRSVERIRDLQMDLEEFVRICVPLFRTHQALAFLDEGNDNRTLPPGTSALVFHPRSRFVRNWSTLMAFVRVWCFLDVPVRIAFHPLYCFSFWYLAWSMAMEVLLALDIILHFHVAYINKKSVFVANLPSIRKHYLSHGFVPAFVASLPLDILMWVSSGFAVLAENYVTSSWLAPTSTRWMRIPRIFLVVPAFRKWHKYLRSSGFSLLVNSLLGLLPLLIGVSHLISCAWWTVGTFGTWNDPNHVEEMQAVSRGDYGDDIHVTQGFSWPSNFVGLGHDHDLMHGHDCITQYMVTFYWTTATLSTNGLITGMEATNWLEVGFVSLAMLVSLTLYAYVLGEISNVVMKADETLVSQRSQLSLVQSVIKSWSIPDDLRENISGHFHDSMGNHMSADIVETSSVFNKLSHSLQVAVARHLSRPLVEKVPLMSQCSDNFIDALCVLLKEDIMMRDAFLFRTNEITDKLYFLYKGHIEFVVEEDNELILNRTLEAGVVFGKLSFFFSMKQTESARSRLNSPGAMLFTLSREDFKALTRLYPQEEAHIVKKVLATYKDAFDLAGEDGDIGPSSTMAEVHHNMATAERQKQQEHIVEMVAAAAEGDLHGLKRVVLEHGLSIDSADYHGRTALHLAAANGHLQLVYFLVGSLQADVNVVDKMGISPLLEAVKSMHNDIANYLRSRKAQLLNEAVLSGELCDMAYHGDLDSLKMLVDNGISIHSTDFDLRSPLHLAASQGHQDVVEYLITKEAKVNARDKKGSTPLQDAMTNGHVEVVSLLRSAGAKVFGDELAYRMCSLGHDDDLDGTKAMLKVGLDLNITDYDNRTLLHLAVCEKSLMVVTHVLKKEVGGLRVNVNTMDRYGATPLDDAIRHNHKVMQSILEEHGARSGTDPELQEMHALAMASARREEEAKARLIEQEQKEHLPEMHVLRICATLSEMLEEAEHEIKSSCIMYHKGVKKLVRPNARESTVIRRVRQLHVCLRTLATMSKQFEWEMEELTQHSNDLSLSVLKLSGGDLREEVRGFRREFKALVSSMDTFLQMGRKNRFNFKMAQSQRVRKLLKQTLSNKNVARDMSLSNKRLRDFVGWDAQPEPPQHEGNDNDDGKKQLWTRVKWAVTRELSERRRSSLLRFADEEDSTAPEGEEGHRPHSAEFAASAVTTSQVEAFQRTFADVPTAEEESAQMEKPADQDMGQAGGEGQSGLFNIDEDTRLSASEQLLPGEVNSVPSDSFTSGPGTP